MTDYTSIRIRLFGDRAATLNCTTCGFSTAVADLAWVPLSLLLTVSDHPCRPPLAAVPPTPRPPAPDAVAVGAFVLAHLVSDVHGVELLDDVFERYQATGGTLPTVSGFARRLREALPPTAEIRREMINGVRARRVVGMRLR